MPVPPSSKRVFDRKEISPKDAISIDIKATIEARFIENLSMPIKPSLFSKYFSVNLISTDLTTRSSSKLANISVTDPTGKHLLHYEIIIVISTQLIFPSKPYILKAYKDLIKIPRQINAWE
jgi:hypothetical protein